MQTKAMLKVVEAVLDDKKAQDIKIISVEGKTSVTDFMVIATGTSARHLNSLSNYVLDELKNNNIRPLGVEGDDGSDWVLVDLGDLILHLMTAPTREFYQLEKLWESAFADAAEHI